MKFGIVFVSLLVPMMIAIYATPATANGVWACNQAGDGKSTFYSNETVYVTSGNITSTGGQNVRVYIVQNNDAWIDGQTLVDATEGGYHSIVTNSSGHIPVTSIWVGPVAGSYDIVADVNNDGVYNSSYDYVNSSTTTGLTILEAPIPTLNVETGLNNPSSHGWDLGADAGHNSMLQLNFSASVESVMISSISLTASGSGNDKEDITVVYLILDTDGDGQYDQGETMLGYKNYFLDDGVVTFQIEDGYLVSTESRVAVLITYSMSNAGQVGDTYKFDVVSISAVGAYTSQAASVVGLPIGSAIKTISGAATPGETTTTTTTISPTTTTTVPTDECEDDADCGGVTCSEKQKTTYKCEYNSNKGVNECISEIESVACCGDADCVEGYYCINYRCEKEGGGVGGWLSGRLRIDLSEERYRWIMISIVVVISAAVVLIFIIKNRQKKPWRSRREYEGEWEGLRGKWGEKK